MKLCLYYYVIMIVIIRMIVVIVTDGFDHISISRSTSVQSLRSMANPLPFSIAVGTRRPSTTIWTLRGSGALWIWAVTSR